MAVAAATVMGAALTVGPGALGAAAAAPRAGARQVLHFYLESESRSFVTAAGKPFTPSGADPPRAGDEIERTDLDYVGNRARHAQNWTASDEQLCIFNSQGDAVCHAQLAIGGSMILAEAIQTTPSATVRETVTGGTGAYRGVSGTLVSVSPTPQAADADLTITLRRA